MAKGKAKKKKREPTQLQTKKNGDTAVYVRCNPEVYALFEQLHHEHITKHMLNPKAFGVGSLIRDLAMKQAQKDKATKTFQTYPWKNYQYSFLRRDIKWTKPHDWHIFRK